MSAGRTRKTGTNQERTRTMTDTKPSTLEALTKAAVASATELKEFRRKNRISSLPYEERIKIINSPEYNALLDSQWVESVETPEGTVVANADIIKRGYNWKMTFSIIPLGSTKRKRFSKEKAAALLG